MAGLAGALVCGFIVAIIPFAPLEGLSPMLGVLVGLWVLAPMLTKSFSSIYNGFEEMRYTLINYIIQEPLKLGMLLILISLGVLGVDTLVLCWTLVYITTMFLVMLVGHSFLIRRLGNQNAFHLRWHEFGLRLRESILYFLPFIGVTVTPGLVILILGLFMIQIER